MSAMKYLSHFLFLNVLSILANCTYAQSGQYLSSEFYSNYVPKKPSSSSLGQFGNVPINYYAGTPEVSFELLRLKGRDIELPLSITYDASGVKTDEFSGEAGLKWSIAVGGYVVRDMKGLPDEHTAEGYWKYSKETDYYSTLDYPKWVNWIEKNERDGSPDEFTIIIPGRSIKFVFNKDKTIMPIPRQNIRISHTMSNNRINGFELITEDGTRYLFGGSSEVVATRRVETLNIRFKYNFKYASTQENFQSGMYQLGSESLSPEANFEEKATDEYTSRWYLKSIISPVGETTKFVYQNTGNVSYAARPAAISVKPSIKQLDAFSYGERRCIRYSFFTCAEYEEVIRGPFALVAAVIKYPRTDPGSMCYTNEQCGVSLGFFNPSIYKATPGHLNSYHSRVTESDIRLLRIESATGNKVVFSTSPRIDLPGTVKVDKISLYDLNGALVSSYRLNYKEYAADESKDYMWPGEALIMFNVGTVTEPDTKFSAHHIRKYFNGRISNEQLVKYVFEGLKEYNYKRFFLESVDQYSKYTNDTIRLYKFDYREPDLLSRRTTPLHNSLGFQRTGFDYVTDWTFQSGKQALTAYAQIFDIATGPARIRGMLTRIAYPSGGYTTFDYDFSTPNPVVKLVRDFDENNKLANQKEIEYLQSAYNVVPENYCVHDFNIWGTSDWMKYVVSSTSSLNDPALTNNVFRGNKSVRVYHGSKTVNNGFEEFTFTSPVDPPYRDIHAPIYSDPPEQNPSGENLPFVTNIYPFPKARDRDFIRGMPLSHKVFAAGKTTPLKTTIYTYQANPYGYIPETVLGLKGGSFNYASHTEPSFWYGHEPEIEKRSRYSRYMYQSEWVVLKKKRTITYDPTISDTTKNFDVCTEYDYDPVHLQQIEMRTYHRDNPGDKKISRTRYVTHTDYNPPVSSVDCQQQLTTCLNSCDLMSDPAQRATCIGNCYGQYYNSCTNVNKDESIAIEHLRNRRQINTPIEVQDIVVAGNQTKLVKAVLYRYRKHGSGEGFSKVKTIHDLSQPVDLTTYMSSRIQSDGTFTFDTRLRLAHTYDSYDLLTANVLKQTSRDGTVSSYQWGVNNSVVTGYVVNPGTQQQQYLYDHIPLVGLRSTTDPNGRYHRFEYDGFNRLRVTRDHDNNILSRYRYHYRGQNESLKNDLIITSCTLVNTPVSLQSAESVPGQTTYQWDFGDGTPAVSTTDVSVQHTWSQKGKYVVKVRKENPEYYAKEAVTLISVQNPVSAVNLTINGPTSYDICSLQPPPQPTTIYATISGDAAAYVWEYKLDNGPWIEFGSGSGAVSKIQTPAPSDFGAPFVEGVFTIRLTASDDCGGSRSAETTLHNYASSPTCRQY
jgi:YD repeat-containing protein